MHDLPNRKQVLERLAKLATERRVGEREVRFSYYLWNINGGYRHVSRYEVWQDGKWVGAHDHYESAFGDEPWMPDVSDFDPPDQS